MLKRCSRCPKELPIADFFSDGKERALCSACRESARSRSKTHYSNHASKVAARIAKYRKRDEAAHKLRKRASRKRYQAKYPEKHAAVQRAYRGRRSGRMLSLSRDRVLRIARATVHGFKAEIHKIYERAARLRGEGHDVHVDHIYPLKGKLVSGLHVPRNLQIVPKVYNLMKHNKVDRITA